MKLPDKLFKAAADGNAAMIARLKARGVSVFCRDDNDNTPLHVAAERGHRAAVYQLLRREGSVLANAHNQAEETPFTLAVRNGHTEIAGLLLKTLSVDVNEQALNSDTPLLRAVAEEKPDIVRLLLGAGAEVNYTNLWHSPLTQAALSNENTDILQLLLKAGADVNAPDDYGSTALQNAAVMGNTRAVSLLIRAGADVNLANEDAIPPLHSAILSRNAATVRALLAAGANPHARMHNIISPTDIAADSPEITTILRKYLTSK